MSSVHRVGAFREHCVVVRFVVTVVETFSFVVVSVSFYLLSATSTRLILRASPVVSF